MLLFQVESFPGSTLSKSVMNVSQDPISKDSGGFVPLNGRVKTLATIPLAPFLARKGAEIVAEGDPLHTP